MLVFRLVEYTLKITNFVLKRERERERERERILLLLFNLFLFLFINFVYTRFCLRI